MPKNVLVSLFILTLLQLGFSQTKPKVILLEGQVSDTTFTHIDNRNFGFRIDWGQGEKDSCKYEFVHARGVAPLSRSRGYLVGTQLVVQDVRRVVPGDRFDFNFEIDGRKFYQSYKVLSTKASESKPWFCDIYFLMNSDTVKTGNYEVYFSFRADSINTPKLKNLLKTVKWSAIKPPALQSQYFSQFIRYYFTDHGELPGSIVINYQKYQLTFELPMGSFYHGQIFAKYSPSEKLHDNSGYEFNSAIEFLDIDVDGWGSSTLFNHYYTEEKVRTKRRMKK